MYPISNMTGSALYNYNLGTQTRVCKLAPSHALLFLAVFRWLPIARVKNPILCVNTSIAQAPAKYVFDGPNDQYDAHAAERWVDDQRPTYCEEVEIRCGTASSPGAFCIGIAL